MCGDGDSAALDRREWRKARKEQAIRTSDRYHHTVIVQESGDKPEVFRHCARCWMVCEALWVAGAEWIDFGLDCGEVWSANFEPLEEPAELAFMTKDEAQAIIRKRDDLKRKLAMPWRNP